MFIIVEGPDGAGKSTAIEQLTMKLWEEGRGTVLVNPKRSPNQHALVEYKERLDWYQPGMGVDLILDRSWYSEMIYGPIWRGHSSVTEDDMRTLEAWALRKGAVVVLLDEDSKTVQGRLSDRTDDPDAQHMSDARLDEYVFQYRFQSPDWRLPKVKFPPGFDHTPEPVIAHASAYERLALELLEENQ